MYVTYDQPVAVSSLSSANQQRVDMVMDTSTRTQCVCCCQPAGGNMLITAGDCTYYVCTKFLVMMATCISHSIPWLFLIFKNLWTETENKILTPESIYAAVLCWFAFEAMGKSNVSSAKSLSEWTLQLAVEGISIEHKINNYCSPEDVLDLVIRKI